MTTKIYQVAKLVVTFIHNNSFGGCEGGRAFFFFNLFPTCSCQVPNVFLKGVPNSTSL